MAVFFFVIFFAIQNKDEVILRFGLYPVQNYQWEAPKIPLFLVILCSLFFGGLIGGTSDLYRHLQLKRAIRQNQKMIDTLEKEIQSLRNLGSDKPSLLKEDS